MQGRVLLCADGATSRLATHLGYCTEAPRGVCSRAFVEGGTHNTDFDGPRNTEPTVASLSKPARRPDAELASCSLGIGGWQDIGSAAVSDVPTHAEQTVRS